MPDTTIGSLPQAPTVDDSSLFVIEQQGEAMKARGDQWKQFARDSVKVIADEAELSAFHAETAEQAARQSALEAQNSAKASAASATNAKTAQTEAASLASQSANSATASKNSETLSQSWAVGGTGSRTGENTDNAKYWAGRAQAEAERVTATPIESVYNIILQDRATGDKYALVIENARLRIVGVADDMNAEEFSDIDVSTGLSYLIVVSNGRLGIQEV